MAMRRPAEVFPPGEILRHEREERGWTQTDLAEIVGRPVGLVSEIIAGKRGISPETARGLGAALGTTPEFWMNLDAAFQLSRVRVDNKEVERLAAALYETMNESLFVDPWELLPDNRREKYRRAVRRVLEVHQEAQAPQPDVAFSVSFGEWEE